MGVEKVTESCGGLGEVSSHFEISRGKLKVKGKGKGILFNVGGQTGKDCILTWADGVKVADRRDRTRNLSLPKRCTNHCTTGDACPCQKTF